MNGPIDIHTHVVPDAFPGYLRGVNDVQWPSIEHGTCGHARVLMGGKPYRDVDERCWNAACRVDGMTAMRIGRQVLSPMPELLSYWLIPEDAQSLARHMNARIARMVAEAPSRFIGFGMVPLQSVELAIQELEHLTGALGLTGIEIGTNVNGKPIGHGDFEPFFAEAERLGVPIFVHPLRPAGMDRLVGPAILEQAVAFPCETALAIASMMTGGCLARHPRLRLAFSHGGGTFGQILPRLQHAWSIASGLQKVMPRAPRDLARDLYYDTLVYDPVALRFLIDQFGTDQILIGTDYPFAIMETAPLDTLDALHLDTADIEKITITNAERFLGTAA